MCFLSSSFKQKRNSKEDFTFINILKVLLEFKDCITKCFDAFCRSDELLVSHVINNTIPKTEQVLCVTKLIFVKV